MNDTDQTQVASELAILRQRVAELESLGTKLRDTEETLNQERSLLRGLIDSLPDFIYVKDTQSRFVIANTAVAALSGVTSPEALIGKTDFDFFPPAIAAGYYADEQAVIQSGESLINHEEPSLDHSTNKAGWLLTTKVVWRDPQGNILGVMGMGRNISELRETQLALAEAHDTLEQRVVERTEELSKAKSRMERVHEFFRSTLEQIGQAVNQGAPRTELLTYVQQAEEQFDRMG